MYVFIKKCLGYIIHLYVCMCLCRTCTQVCLRLTWLRTQHSWITSVLDRNDHVSGSMDKHAPRQRMGASKEMWPTQVNEDQKVWGSISTSGHV